ncbi:hypothetical protein KAR91_67280 [Candidatus Pacearchaeota archaeon]|nr:hypothetical protein [Candidatus Pacearchaeota archaeon]
MYTIKQSTAITVPFFVHDASGDPVTGLVDGGFTLKRISKNGAAFGAMTVTITEMENGWYSIPLSTSHSDTLGLLSLTFQGASGKQVNLQWRVEAKLVDDLNDLAQSAILSDATPFQGADIPAILIDTGTTLPAEHATAQADLDTLTGSDGATLATAQANYAPSKAGDAMALTAGGVDDIWNEPLTGGTHAVANSSGRRLRDLQEFGTYDNGAIWIDTINGSPGTTDYESGTVFNPVNTIADANTLAASLGITRFEIAPGSSMTFVASQEGQVFSGNDWTLALGGQSISNSHFEGAFVSGIGTTATGDAHFDRCNLSTLTLGAAHLTECGLMGTLTLGAADTYTLADCYSEVAGNGAPIIDFGVAVGNTSLNMRHYSGGIQIEAMGDTGADTMSLEGDGQFIEGTCTGGTVAIRGNFTISGIINLTLSDDARFSLSDILSDSNAFNGADIASILADTNELQTDDIPGLIAALNNLAQSEILSDATPFAGADIASILTDTGTTIPGLIAALNDLSAANVNTEVSDVLKTDTISELAQGKPTATPTFEKALMLVYMALRNQIDVTATLKEFHNDAGVVIYKKALSDNGTTYSEAEGETGP